MLINLNNLLKNEHVNIYIISLPKLYRPKRGLLILWLEVIMMVDGSLLFFRPSVVVSLTSADPKGLGH